MFLAKLRSGVFRSNSGRDESPLYLMPDGRTTHMKGQAKTFATDEELERFLNETAKEGKKAEVEKEPV